MALNRGPEWLPTDGRQDTRPVLTCSTCGIKANCYRGPLREIINTPVTGEFRLYYWYCASCMAAIVGEALRDAE